MVEISNIKEKCFAEFKSGCGVLSSSEYECSPQCPFYKPTGCEDWVRRETEDGIWLIPPEEYERSNNGQSIQDKRKLYWFIKSV